ncbi:hypothetical protein [Vibrio sp. M260118]|uniref:hypothetical protein n=1 Tax=Vibrio sp. M260118 TaxID=3020896 RepID=UPI002F404386
MNTYTCKSPVLFLTFNRLDVTKHVFSEIRKAQPPHLYFASDGPREGRSGEKEKVQAVRDYVLDNIDWQCEVHTLLREKNLGCRDAVSGALDWFFEHEEMGIVLEDDCLPDPTFFQFCDELLEKYRTDTRIMCITGNNFQNGTQRGTGDYSYYFSQLNHCWGWASWRRAWRTWHDANKYFDEIEKNGSNNLTHNKNANTNWMHSFRNAKKGHVNTWDYTWTMANLINSGLTVTPQVNLVHNIGFGEEATHTSSGTCPESNAIPFPLKHPSYVLQDKEADDYAYLKHMGFVSVFQRIKRKLFK